MLKAVIAAAIAAMKAKQSQAKDKKQQAERESLASRNEAAKLTAQHADATNAANNQRQAAQQAAAQANAADSEAATKRNDANNADKQASVANAQAVRNDMLARQQHVERFVQAVNNASAKLVQAQQTHELARKRVEETARTLKTTDESQRNAQDRLRQRMLELHTTRTELSNVTEQRNGALNSLEAVLMQQNLKQQAINACRSHVDSLYARRRNVEEQISAKSNEISLTHEKLQSAVAEKPQQQHARVN